MSVGGVLPPARVVAGLRRRIEAAELVSDKDALLRVGPELGTCQSLLRLLNTRVVSGVLRVFEITLSRDDPGSRRSTTDGCLAVHRELPASQITPLVKLP